MVTAGKGRHAAQLQGAFSRTPKQLCKLAVGQTPAPLVNVKMGGNGSSSTPKWSHRLCPMVSSFSSWAQNISLRRWHDLAVSQQPLPNAWTAREVLEIWGMFLSQTTFSDSFDTNFCQPTDELERVSCQSSFPSSQDLPNFRSLLAFVAPSALGWALRSSDLWDASASERSVKHPTLQALCHRSSWEALSSLRHLNPWRVARAVLKA